MKHFLPRKSQREQRVQVLLLRLPAYLQAVAYGFNPVTGLTVRVRRRIQWRIDLLEKSHP